MTYVVLTAGIDLSVGALMFLAVAAISAGLTAGLPPVLLVLAIPVLTLLLGTFNGGGGGEGESTRPDRHPGDAPGLPWRWRHLTEQRSLVLSADVRFLGYGDIAGVRGRSWSPPSSWPSAPTCCGARASGARYKRSARTRPLRRTQA